MKRYWVIAPYTAEEAVIFDRVWGYDLRNGTIAVGVGTRIGPSLYDMKDISELRQKTIEVYGELRKGKCRQIWNFIHEISLGDIIIARRGLKKIMGIGEVTEKAFFDYEQGTKRVGFGPENIPLGDNFVTGNFLKVKWFGKEEISFDRQTFSLTTIYEISAEKYASLIKGEHYADKKEAKTRPTVDKTIYVAQETYERPEWLHELLGDIDKLKNDPEHKERAHESLVESFYNLLGFVKFSDIKHRQGRIDITIEYEGKVIIVNEVKKSWGLSYRDRDAVIQVYNYSLETGARFVVITNGDYYAIFDKDKGRSYESNFVGNFQLSELRKKDLELIDFLRKDKIIQML
ncbi:MAG: type I restriction enzyme HsdR N-terminal domain-containing protein [Candidatus Omnitrophica bacterium]|nr:type I restriction enzyme HsdR N-terminal domain-containing protein [Candidatus Omnitrophota bacterium]